MSDKGKLKKFLKIFGPGLITGASDDDPSGVATYAQTGAVFGYKQLWTPLFSLPFMTAIQEICGRIGLVTGRGLAGVMRKHYSRKLLYPVVFLLFAANTINIGADLGAMAASLRLLIDLPFPIILVLIVTATLVLEIFVSYKIYATFLKYLAFLLLVYVGVIFFVDFDWKEILNGTLLPHLEFSREYVLNLAAILGTTISPYLFFWQADEEVEEEVAHKKLRMMGAGAPRVTKKDIKAMRLDTAVGMVFSNLIMFFIILAAGATLHVNGIFDVGTASAAAEALRPIAGDFSSWLFALGILGTGMLSIPVLAGSASYAFAEAFGLKEGLYRKLKQAHGFYGVIAIATIAGLAISFTPIKPFHMLYYTAIINGIIAPPLLFFIMKIANNRKIMKEHVNSKVSNWLGWTATVLMSLVAVALVWVLLR